MPDAIKPVPGRGRVSLPEAAAPLTVPIKLTESIDLVHEAVKTDGPDHYLSRCGLRLPGLYSRHAWPGDLDRVNCPGCRIERHAEHLRTAPVEEKAT